MSRTHPLVSKDGAIKITVACNEPKYSEQWICSEYENTWKEMGNNHSSGDSLFHPFHHTLKVDIHVRVMVPLFTKLYNDNDFTDFNLSSAEGSVAVHKACLASHSDMFKTLFTGNWKETAECHVEPEGVTLQTLQQLKDYLYLGTLPTLGLRQLLLLAKCYMINNLKVECISRLARKVTPEDLFDLLEFARENRIPELTLAIIQLTSNKVVESVTRSLKQL